MFNFFLSNILIALTLLVLSSLSSFSTVLVSIRVSISYVFPGHRHRRTYTKDPLETMLLLYCICVFTARRRNYYTVSNIITCDGHKLPWSNEIRYLGTYIVQSRQFKCSLDYAKKSFFRSLNAIFGKIGRNASEEVILELIRSKCIPILIYGLECFALTKSDLKSLDFAVNRFLMKLFRSNNIEIIAECRRYFQFNLPSELIEKKKTKFEENYNLCVLVLRDICVRVS